MCTEADHLETASLVRKFYQDAYRPLRLVSASPRTDEAYLDTLSAWDRWPSRVPLKRIDDLVFAKWLGWLAERSSRSTTNKHRAHLLCILRLAVKRKKLKALPDVPPLKTSPKLPEAWTVDEVERIISVARQVPGRINGLPARNWWASLLLTIYDTGSRIGAILAVEPRNLSLPERSLVLLGSTTKSGRPQYCRLSDQTVAAVAAIYDPSRKYVWPWPHIRATLYRRAKKLFKAAGVPHGKDNGGLFHRMRRTSATLVAAHGGNPQTHLGHSDARVTYKHYVDPAAVGGGQLDFLPRPGQANGNGCSAWLLD